MQSMADKAWQKAADCARRAEQTYDPTVRDLYRRMGDSWIAVANRCEFLDDAVMPDSVCHRAFEPFLLDVKDIPQVGPLYRASIIETWLR